MLKQRSAQVISEVRIFASKSQYVLIRNSKKTRNLYKTKNSQITLRVFKFTLMVSLILIHAF